MSYDENSFIAGVAVGRQLKGWTTQRSGGVPTNNYNAAVVQSTNCFIPLPANPSSLTDYLTPDFSTRMEIGIVAKCFATQTYAQRLLGARTGNSTDSPFVDIAPNPLPIPYSYAFGIGNGSQNVVVPKATHPVLLNEWLRFVLQFSNGVLDATIFRADGTVYFTGSASGLTGLAAAQPSLGGIPSQMATSCVLDLGKCYIKANGSLVWGID